MGGERRYRQDSMLPSQEIEGEAVIVVPAKSEMHVLDEVGTFLWTELRRPQSAEELARSVCNEFDVGQDQAENDVRAFLETLMEKGLLTRE